MLKAVVILLVVAIGGLVVFYFAGGYGSFNPDEQGREAKAKIEARIKAGKATWKDVVKIAKPQVVRYFIKQKRGDVDIITLGGETDFDEKLMGDTLKGNGAPNGFQFTYRYGGVSFSVGFDAKGNAEGVTDEITAANLFNP